MDLKKILLTSMFLFLPVSLKGQNYPLNLQGFPSTIGIRKYVPEQEISVANQFQEMVKDSLYEFYFDVDNLEKYSDTENPDELGNYESKQITITEEELFQAYELKNLSIEERARLISSNKFVRGVMIHELAHCYVDQVMKELSIGGFLIDVNYKKEYGFTTYKKSFNVSFIEEGIAEYLASKAKEIVLPKKPHVPKKIEYLLNEKNKFPVKYQYAPYFLKDFLDENGIKKGIQILVANSPPTTEEILNPPSFFQRLKPSDAPVKDLRYEELGVEN